ncbi:type II secretion system F family protein [Candidatus Peregrinibacteria bacterium]|nr:type II secretion system F family protein [Candidatus Peregrinibacteria bacterium]
MSAFVSKIGDTFSDIWFEIELFFGKIFKRKAKKNPVVSDSHISSTSAGTDASYSGTSEKENENVEKMPFGLRMLRMGFKDRLFFYDQMSTLIGSGVTLIESLSLVQAQTQSKNLKKLYKEIIHDINTGMSLADSMYRFPHVFPRMQGALVEAGEKSGNLKAVLAELVEEMESSQDFKRKIKGAMFYPIILLVLALGMVTGMMTFVIPKISSMYKEANVALPTITQKVIGLSEFMVSNWMMILLYIVGTILFLWGFFCKTKMGRKIWEEFVSITPVFGTISKEKNLMAISANMSMLMKSGVLISDAFEITENTLDNIHYKEALKEIHKGVVMGKEVSEMMGLEDIKAQKFKVNKLFPLQMAQLMHIGETTGTIAQMLTKLKQNYHKSIDYKLKNISTVIEPLMIFLVAIIVGVILLAVMMPFFNIGSTIN